MTPERWHQITAIFHAALAREPSERETFLAEACRADAMLRSDVDAMLVGHEGAGQFGEVPLSTSVSQPRSGPGVATLATGSCLGPYQILSPLGAGGMGQVYKAADPRLHREVAIKVLPPVFTADSDRLARFEREARVLAALNHPHIGAIYGLEETDGIRGLVLELVEGATLADRLKAGPVPVAEALSFGEQIAEALEAAHGKGIIHRDLKPANVKVTPEGRVKVLDFGLAKGVLGTEERQDPSQPSTLTALDSLAGQIVGTPPYMSPEQARGSAVDERTDIWAFGCLLYELLTGKRAFVGETPSDTITAVLEREPDWSALPATTPARIRELLQQCLQKDGNRRLPAIADASRAMLASAAGERPPVQRRSAYRWALRAGAALTLGMFAVLAWKMRPRAEGPGNSIAVLPFVDMSGDRENEYFSDGITEELIHALAKVEGIRVSSRTSAFAFKGKDVGVRKIGEELNVATVLEGSVRRERGNVRVTAQLVNAADGYHLWSKTYDRELKNIFALEDELARSIAQALAPRLGARQPAPLVRPATVSTAAHDDYLKGRYNWNLWTPESFRRAISFFQQAIAEDPSYALAYAGLADSHALLIDRGSAAAEHLPKAKEAARRALELDGTLAEAHVAMGMIGVREWDWSTAEREYRRAIELDPGYAPAHQRYALLLTWTGRRNEARMEIDRARQLDPASPQINTNSALVHRMAREYPQAIEEAKKAIELNPHWTNARISLGAAYTLTASYREALEQIDVIAIEDKSTSLGMRGYVFAISGQRDAARRVLAELADLTLDDVPSSMACIHAGLGDKDAAFAWLDKAYAEHSAELIYLKVRPEMDPLRSDPRFARLLQRMHLE